MKVTVILEYDDGAVTYEFDNVSPPAGNRRTLELSQAPSAGSDIWGRELASSIRYLAVDLNFRAKPGKDSIIYTLHKPVLGFKVGDTIEALKDGCFTWDEKVWANQRYEVTEAILQGLTRLGSRTSEFFKKI